MSLYALGMDNQSGECQREYKKKIAIYLIILPPWSLTSADICGGALGDIAELEEDEGVLFTESLSVRKVTALDRNDDQLACL